MLTDMMPVSRVINIKQINFVITIILRKNAFFTQNNGLILHNVISEDVIIEPTAHFTSATPNLYEQLAKETK